MKSNIAAGLSVACWTVRACLEPTLEHGLVTITLVCFLVCIWSRKERP